MRELEADAESAADGIEHPQTFGHHLGTDAIAGDHGDLVFHVAAGAPAAGVPVSLISKRFSRCT